MKLNVSDDEEYLICEILKSKGEGQLQESLILWQLNILKSIEQSEMTRQEKLRAVAEQWAQFDYPESWRTFIHYMPSEDIDSSEETVYQKFCAYLNSHR